MAATTTDRNTPRKSVDGDISLPMAADTKIPIGALVAKDASGNAVNAADTAGLVVVGVCVSDAGHGWSGEAAYGDNTDGAAGAKRIRCGTGVFGFKNGGAIDQSDVLKAVMVADNQTVNRTGTNSVKAGVLLEIDPTDATLWIGIGPKYVPAA